MARRMTSPVLVGRADVVGQLQLAFESVRDSVPRHVVIGGEAGVGKTRMLTEARVVAEAAEMRVLQGGCVLVGDEGLPFAPYTEIIRALIAADGLAQVRAVAGRPSGDLARLVPTLGAADSEPEQGQWAQTRLYEALLDLFRGYARRVPLVIQLEDLHWADSDTLAATSFLLRAIHDEPIAIVATFRADEVTRKHPLRPWLSEVSRDSDVERIDLEPLDEDEIAVLVRHILGQDLPGPDLDEIQLRSDGNPFFIEELLASRVDVGTALPSTLRDVLLSRIEVLPETSQHLLEIAAVGGRVVEHEALISVVGEGDVSIDADIRRLVDSGLLVPTRALDDDDAYAFRHVLLLEAVYEGMLPHERRRFHRAWGEALAAHDAAASTGAAYLLQLAHHWREARDDRALSATIAAGASAVKGFSFDMASREHEEALALWVEDDDRVDIDHVELLERTARAAYLASRYRRAVAACNAAIAELGDRDAARLTELLILLGRTTWVSGDWAGATPIYEKALATAPAEPPIVRIKALAGLGQVYMLHARLREARPLCVEAIEGAIAIGDRVMEGHGRNTLGAVLAGLGETKAANASIAEALEIAFEVGDADDIGRGYVNRAEIESWSGYPETAFESSLEGMRVAEEMGIAASYGAYLGFGAVSFGFEAGRWDDAANVLELADRVAGPTEGTYVYRSSYVLEFKACRGDDDFEALWRETRRLLRDRPPSDNHGLIYMAGIEAAAFGERFEEAVATAWEGIDLIVGADVWMRLVELARVTAWPVADLGRAARNAGDRPGLDQARNDMTRLMELSTTWWGASDRDDRLAQVLRLDAAQVQAEQHRMEGTDDPAMWRDIADGWTAVGRPFRSAMTRWRQAEAAEAAADRDTAVEAMRTAHGVATELGAKPLVAHLETMARRLRASVGAAGGAVGSEGAAAYGLTRREREVLELVAAGHTNRHIAASLFISESTAGVHVSNILGKLGVSTRTEAARVALDQGLVGPDS